MKLCSSNYHYSTAPLNEALTPYSPSKTLFKIKTGSKNKNIHFRDFKMLFSNMNFNFSHFNNFNFAHFEFEESFGLIWVKLQNGQFHLQISISNI